MRSARRGVRPQSRHQDLDREERRLGLSIKAANYSPEQLKAEQAVLDALKPGEDLVALQHAFDAADEAKQDLPEMDDRKA